MREYIKKSKRYKQRLGVNPRRYRRSKNGLTTVNCKIPIAVHAKIAQWSIQLCARENRFYSLMEVFAEALKEFANTLPDLPTETAAGIATITPATPADITPPTAEPQPERLQA